MRSTDLIAVLAAFLPAALASCDLGTLKGGIRNGKQNVTTFRDCEWSACTQEKKKLGVKDERGRTIVEVTSRTEYPHYCIKSYNSFLNVDQWEDDYGPEYLAMKPSKFPQCCPEYGSDCGRFKDVEKGYVKYLTCANVTMHLSTIFAVLVALPAALANCDLGTRWGPPRAGQRNGTEHRDCQWSRCTREAKQVGDRDDQGRFISARASPMRNTHYCVREKDRKNNKYKWVDGPGRWGNMRKSHFGECCAEYGADCQQIGNTEYPIFKYLTCANVTRTTYDTGLGLDH
ncbi:hypothetical protein PT974_04884 [Cladobotryum mycophilum]|uniref:Uncharacterized protein n=1 Tax=Cladobotryum mycophilum TaxID=491253 RepID=A0ABR0SRQ3_9HYPO